MCVLFKNSLCKKLVPPLESPKTSDEDFKLTTFFIPEFSLLSCELNNVTFKFILYWYYIKAKKEKNYSILMVSCEKSKIVSFVSSIMKNIVASSALSRFQLKLNFCIAFWSGSKPVYLNLLLPS